MIRLSIGNSTSQITGMTTTQHAALSKELSSEEEGYGFFYVGLKSLSKLRVFKGKVVVKDVRGIPRPVKNRAKRQYGSIAEVKAALEKRDVAVALGFSVKRTTLLSKRGQFPSGLLTRAQKHLKGTNYQVDDLRIRPKKTPGMFVLKDTRTPYPEQIEAATVAALTGRGCVTMPTGAGKSVTMGHLVHLLQCPVLVLVPNLALKRQLTQTFSEMFEDASNIVVENIDSTRLSSLVNYPAVIIDEAHRGAAQTYRDFLKKCKNTFYRFHFTATPFRSREAEAIVLESIIGDVIYRLSYKDAVKKGYIVPLEAYFYTLPETHCSNPRSWPAVYSDLIVNNTTRNMLIASLVKNLQESRQSTLVLVKEIEHGQLLQESTGVDFANGQKDESEWELSMFAAGEMGSLIATEGIASEGVDTKAAEWCILGSTGRSRNSLIQKCGRVLRRFGDKESGKAILFLDPSHKWLVDHFEAQCTYLREEFGITPSELPLDAITTKGKKKWI